VADPWTEDFTALGHESRSQLRPMAATRTHVLSAQETSRMRFFTNRPLLAVLLVLALLGVASGAAYAVNRVFLSVDPEMTAPEIEEDIQAQLEESGVQSTVHAEKTDGKIEIRIQSSDEHLGSALDVDVANGLAIKDVEQASQVRFELATKLTDAQQKQLVDALGGKGFLDILTTDRHDSAATAAAMKRELASHGFKDVEIAVKGTGFTVTVKSPPTE
jgi:hypothetical protein